MLGLFLSLMLVFSGVPVASAQRIGDSGAVPASGSSKTEAEDEAPILELPDIDDGIEAYIDFYNRDLASEVIKKLDAEEALEDSDDDTSLSQTEMPTLDGSKRGGVAIGAVVTKENAHLVQDDELIFLYYKDFKINRSAVGSVSCDVTFVITTTLNRQLSSLNFRLKWPEMETAVSFLEVDPNTETILNYTLLGQGCYSMDKIPNIIVNRCRVRGLTQQQCAAKIRWLK